MEKPKKIISIQSKQSFRDYFKDLFAAKELFLFMVWRDILVRYKQAVLGLLWALARPLLNIIIFVILFGYVVKLPNQEVPYIFFVLAGLLPWQLVANTLQNGTTSLINNATLISKVYFPRMILPLSSVAVNFVDFMLGFVLFAGAIALTGWVSWSTVWIFPFILLQTLILAAAVSLLLSAVAIKYHDFNIITPYLVQLGVFLSPVGYLTDLFPAYWMPLFILNPMVGIIESSRFALFNISSSWLIYSEMASLVVTAGLVVIAVRYFRNCEKTFADIA